MSTILIVSPVPTAPPTAGNRVRIRALAEALMQCGHEVHFLHVEQEAGDPVSMRAAWGVRLTSLPYRKPRALLRRGLRRIAKTLQLGLRYQSGIDEWYDPAIDVCLDRLLETHRFDAVMVEYAFMSRALCRVPPGILRVLDTHDVFADRYRRYLAEGMAPKWFSCSPRSERKALQRADVVLAIQQNEGRYFLAQGARRVATVGHFIDLAPQPEVAAIPGRVLLIGSNNPINLQSLAWFLDRVWPDVRAACPQAQLALAGNLADKAPARPDIERIGRVNDVASIYATAQVVINPMQFGTGLKIKSIEALGYARSLVSTRCGAEGLEDGADKAFLIADEPAAFGRCVLNLLLDPERNRQLAQEGHAFAIAYNRDIMTTLTQLFTSGGGGNQALHGVG